MSIRTDAELNAMVRAWELIEPLAPDAQRRATDYLRVRIGESELLRLTKELLARTPDGANQSVTPQVFPL